MEKPVFGLEVDSLQVGIYEIVDSKDTLQIVGVDAFFPFFQLVGQFLVPISDDFLLPGGIKNLGDPGGHHGDAGPHEHGQGRGPDSGDTGHLRPRGQCMEERRLRRRLFGLQRGLLR